jgi:membrane protein implicated in regulation of membrane protease activity
VDWFDGVDAAWVWLTLGLVLAAAEMVVPGVFLLWLAGAALITGLITFGTGMGLPIQILVFCAMSILAVFAGRQYLRDHPIRDADPLMNRKIARLVGQNAKVTVAIEKDELGRVRVGDSEWLARSDSALEAGTPVRVSGGEGSVLKVEPMGGSVLPPADTIGNFAD